MEYLSKFSRYHIAIPIKASHFKECIRLTKFLILIFRWIEKKKLRTVRRHFFSILKWVRFWFFFYPDHMVSCVHLKNVYIRYASSTHPIYMIFFLSCFFARRNPRSGYLVLLNCRDFCCVYTRRCMCVVRSVPVLACMWVPVRVCYYWSDHSIWFARASVLWAVCFP